MRSFLTLCLALSFSLGQSCQAATNGLDLKTSSQLRLLELKYFEHTFDSDTVEDRVERIEQLIRGQALDGNPQDRVNKIVADLVADGESLSPYNPVDTSASQNPSRSGTPSRDSQGNNDDNDESENSGQSNSASTRTSYIDTGKYPHVTNLEKEILGKNYEGEPLPARLARLETKAFASVTNSNNFSARTDRLEDYAERVLHNKPFAVNQDIDKTYIIPARSSYPTASNPAGISLQQEESALNHFFGPGRNLTRGFDGETPTPPPTHFEDPEVYEKNPPAKTSRMITQVGWCEVQEFGHTFPDMHLTERLRQLNDKLGAVRGKQSDMQLMDDLSPIINAILAEKSGHASISSGNALTR